jgi:hypothetical protein
MVAIRWAQGRLRELWPDIEDHGEQFPWIPSGGMPLPLANSATSRWRVESWSAQAGVASPIFLATVYGCCTCAHSPRRVS